MNTDSSSTKGGIPRSRVPSLLLVLLFSFSTMRQQFQIPTLNDSTSTAVDPNLDSLANSCLRRHPRVLISYGVFSLWGNLIDFAEE